MFQIAGRVSAYISVHAAFHENLCLTGKHGFWGWSSEVLQLWRSCEPEYAAGIECCVEHDRMDLLNGVEAGINEDEVIDGWSDWWDKCWETAADPRVAASSEVVCATYKAWMQVEADVPAPYVNYSGIIPHDHLMDLMQFRLGAHWLRVVTGRWEGGGIPRTDRLCQKCPCFKVEDEKHFLFECPAYQHIRNMDRFRGLFEECQDDMAAFMCHPVQSRVAALIHALRECRDVELLLVNYDTHLDRLSSDPESDIGDFNTDCIAGLCPMSRRSGSLVGALEV